MGIVDMQCWSHSVVGIVDMQCWSHSVVGIVGIQGSAGVIQ